MCDPYFARDNCPDPDRPASRRRSGYQRTVRRLFADDLLVAAKSHWSSSKLFGAAAKVVLPLVGSGMCCRIARLIGLICEAGI